MEKSMLDKYRAASHESNPHMESYGNKEANKKAFENAEFKNKPLQEQSKILKERQETLGNKMQELAKELKQKNMPAQLREVKEEQFKKVNKDFAKTAQERQEVDKKIKEQQSQQRTR